MECPPAPIKQPQIKELNNGDGTCCRKLFADNEDYIPLEQNLPVTKLSDEQLAYINRGRDIYEPIEYQLK